MLDLVGNLDRTHHGLTEPPNIDVTGGEDRIVYYVCAQKGCERIIARLL